MNNIIAWFIILLGLVASLTSLGMTIHANSVVENNTNISKMKWVENNCYLRTDLHHGFGKWYLCNIPENYGIPMEYKPEELPKE